MKLSQVALVTVAVAACSVGLWALQVTPDNPRIADFGFGNDDSPTNVKAEFYWSRLAYTNWIGRGTEAWISILPESNPLRSSSSLM